MRNEGRFRVVERKDKARFERLAAEAETFVRRRWAIYEKIAADRVAK